MSEFRFSKKQISDCRHMLGLTQSTKSYRNYYCAGVDDMDSFEELVSEGLAVKYLRGSELGGIYYHLTESGRELVKEYIGGFKELH